MEFYYILFYIVGMLCGAALCFIVLVGSQKQGVLEIDNSKEDKDRYLLVITTPLEDLNQRKFLFFKVKNKSA